MPCYHPQIAYRSRQGRNPETGSWPIVFNVKQGYHDQEVVIPCGKCIGCKLEHSRKWAVRCVLEASLYQENSFITLTYNNQNIPENNTLIKKDFQKFIKKLQRNKTSEGKKVRYYGCGEYGEKGQRPHYHAAIFGYNFPDKTIFKSQDNINLYQSKELTSLWGKGHCLVGDVTFESAAYIARYCTKKITGEMSNKHYGKRIPEFALMSRKPGLAREWLDKYKSDVINTDKIILKKTLQISLPRYYNDIIKKENPVQYQKLLTKRKKYVKQNEKDNTWERLIVKEELKQRQFNQLKRSLELC